MSIQKVGPWDRAAATLKAYATRFDTVVQGAVLKEAARHERDMKLGIRDQKPGGQKFKPLSPITIHLKRSSKALIDKGDLIRSIGTRPITSKAVFVGVHRTARNRDGRSLANVAAIQEFGAGIDEVKTREVTEKMEKFFRALFMKGLWPGPPGSLPRKGSRVRIRIPARPFVGPVFKKLKPGRAKRIMRDVQLGMGLASRL